LVAKYYGITPIQAAVEIDSMYSLGLRDQYSKNYSRGGAQQARRQRELKKERELRFKTEMRDIQDFIVKYLCLLDNILDWFAPSDPDDDISPLYVYAVHSKPYYEYLYAEAFVRGDNEVKTLLWRDFDKEAICSELIRHLT
jgi:hypothetical protein